MFQTNEVYKPTINNHTIVNVAPTSKGMIIISNIWFFEKLYLIQRHLYEHFDLYFFKCNLCNDIFRYTTQFKDHQEAHKKAMKKSGEDLSSNSSSDMIGNYHLATDFHFFPDEDEAKRIIESYFYFDQTEAVFVCKICSDAQNTHVKTFQH